MAALEEQPESKRIRLTTTEDTDQQGDSVEVSRVLCEEDFGIKCYITEGFDPIPGVVKQRFSDFVVNEIDLQGEVVHLTSLECSPQPAQQSSSAAAAVPVPEIDLNKSPLAADKLEGLRQLADSLDHACTVRLEAPEDKDKRRDIHMFIKTHFPSLTSNCVEVDNVKYLDVKVTGSGGGGDKRSGGRRGRQSDNRWPSDRPAYVHFTLYKEFKDTMEAIDVISKYTHIRPQTFSYAGTKDRRAKTSQRVCAHKVNMEKLHGVNKRLQGMAMGHFSYQQTKLNLGQLSGNRFKVVLRNVNTTADNLQKAADSLRQRGFVNYFGMQRFGTTSVPTYEVGKLLLKSQLDKALDLIMTPRDSDRGDVREAKKFWIDQRDSEATLARLPKACNIERRLMQGVSRVGAKNVPQAFESLPRQTRQLYLHSYQSFIWNKLVTRRIEAFGLTPLPGDLVYDHKAGPEAKHPTDEEADDDDAMMTAAASVRRISEEEVGDYKISDIIIPLPGYNIQLPENEIRLWMEEMLAEDNLTLADMKTKYKDYRLPGSYRHIVVKPSDVTSRLAYYDDVTEELVQGDLDLVKNQTLTLADSGKYQAAILEFSLPSSTYATMLLREVMRIDTSARHHSTLNTMSSQLQSEDCQLSSSHNVM